MEGICAILSFDKPIDELDNKISLMAKQLSDGETLNVSKITGENWGIACGAWQEAYWSQISFVHKEDNLIIAGIAELYNLPELVKKFEIPSTELGRIITACYHIEPNDWPLQLRGTFAFIVWDLTKQKLSVVTDRIGIRPIHWYKDGKVYYIGSRINTIRKVCGRLETEPTAIYAYMHHNMIPSPMTVFKNVYKVEPGYMLQVDAKQNRQRRYWDITNTPKLTGSVNQISEQIYSTLDNSVELMQNGVADARELACFLSGGTDSSTICGLLSKKSQEPVEAYSIGFPENSYDEMLYARIASRTYGLNHHEYYMQPDDILEHLNSISKAYDEPFNNSSAFPAYKLARLANSNGAHYLIAGDGGDEIFAGNERYSTQQIFRNYSKIPLVIRQALIEPLMLNRLEKLPVFRKGGNYIRRAKMPEVERLHSFRYVSDEEMFLGSFLYMCDRDAVSTISASHFDRLTDAELLDRHLYLDMKFTITDNDLRKVTRMCELAHVRVRYPMLDHSVVELGFQIPVNLKLKGVKGLRYIFKHAFRQILPKEILTKPKWGFGLPISQWLRSEPKIRDFTHDLLFDKRHLQRGYFNPQFVEKLWQRQLQDSTSYFGAVTWQLVMLEAWQRLHIAGESLKI